MARPCKGQATEELLRTFPALKTQQNKGEQNFLEGAKLLTKPCALFPMGYSCHVTA